MEKEMSVGRCVTIGDTLAETLGYQKLVGATAIIQQVMEALCRVTVIAGSPEVVGVSEDIHKDDCVIESQEPKQPLSAVAIPRLECIFYSVSPEIVEFVQESEQYIVSDTIVKHDIKEIHDFLDEMMEKYPNKPRSYRYPENTPNDWNVYSLDDESCRRTSMYRLRFKEKLEREERLRKAAEKEDHDKERLIPDSAVLKKVSEDLSITFVSKSPDFQDAIYDMNDFQKQLDEKLKNIKKQKESQTEEDM